MTELTAEAVDNLVRNCLFKEGESTTGAVIVEGIVTKFGFHPERLAQAKAPLMDMIQQLPDQFLKNKGGGWTFLNLCNRKDESQWTGEHKTMEALVCLAIGAGIGAYCAPRDIWPVFPGGMPYVVFDLPTIS